MCECCRKKQREERRESRAKGHEDGYISKKKPSPSRRMKSCGKSNTRGDFCTPSTVRCRDDFLSLSLLFLSRPAGCIQAARLRFSQFCKKAASPKSQLAKKKDGRPRTRRQAEPHSSTARKKQRQGAQKPKAKIKKKKKRRKEKRPRVKPPRN